MRLLYIIAFALLTLSCAPNNQSAKTEQPPRPTKSADDEWQEPIEKIGVSEIFPTADGGAYVITPNGRLWYVKEQKAYRVAESAGQPPRATVTDRSAGFALLNNERHKTRELTNKLNRQEGQ